MSYYQMVFEPDAAPKGRQSFLEWFKGQTSWNEGHSYDDPAVASENLRAWFDDMRQIFPPLNGPCSREELPEDEATATDYSIGKKIIYAAFAWSKADEAQEAVFVFAAKHSLGVFDLGSNQNQIWLPKNGQMILIS